MHVLVVEDDPSVSHWLANKLCCSGHSCRTCDDGGKALTTLQSEAFDVVVLDRVLPSMDGIQVLDEMRDKSCPPVLILSANDQSSDRVEGLRAGAEDYLGKPFDYNELLLRLELLARRRKVSGAKGSIEVEDLYIDLNLREVRRGGRQITLTDKEFKLLRVLAERHGQTVTRSMLLEKVWGYDFDPQTNLIDVHLSKLRNKIDRGFERALIRTVRAIGYVLA